jgi:UTP-glucose-1-phosphate uridylyltransferase
MRLTQAILPVAGFGTRFLPWTKVVPKELLPIGNVPIIALLVDECLSVGINDICFVISRGKEAIPEYFEPHRALERELETRGKLHMLEELKKYDNVNFHVVYQNEMKGDGHAILQAHYWVGSDPVAVLFGDNPEGLNKGDPNAACYEDSEQKDRAYHPLSLADSLRCAIPQEALKLLRLSKKDFHLFFRTSPQT